MTEVQVTSWTIKRGTKVSKRISVSANLFTRASGPCM